MGLQFVHFFSLESLKTLVIHHKEGKQLLRWKKCAFYKQIVHHNLDFSLEFLHILLFPQEIKYDSLGNIPGAVSLNLMSSLVSEFNSPKK